MRDKKIPQSTFLFTSSNFVTDVDLTLQWKKINDGIQGIKGLAFGYLVQFSQNFKKIRGGGICGSGGHGMYNVLTFLLVYVGTKHRNNLHFIPVYYNKTLF